MDLSRFFSHSIMMMFKWCISENIPGHPFLDREECPAILDLLRPCEISIPHSHWAFFWMVRYAGTEGSRVQTSSECLAD